MKQILTAILVAAVLILGIKVWNNAGPILPLNQYRHLETVKNIAQSRNIQYIDVDNKLVSKPIRVAKKINTQIVLEDSNTIVLSGPVTNQSISQVLIELQAKDLSLEPKKPIYLVLNTPGGSIFAGMDLIDYVNSLDRKVYTVTLFSASMGFQFVQNFDKRYVAANGTLMSHRAAGGIKGQFDGELESRYAMIKAVIDNLEAIAADRMGITIPEYKKMIVNEYWTYGGSAVVENSADEVVNVKCGKSLTGTKHSVVRTLFGSMKVVLSKCPMIKGVLSISNISVSLENYNRAEKAIIQGYSEPRNYVENFITTGDHYNMFP